MEAQDDPEALRSRVAGAFAGLPPGWSELVDLDPDFVRAFINFVKPLGDSSLPAKYRALLALAVAASPTTLDAGAVARHINEAFDHGATDREVLDVIELVSILGIHSLTAGLPLVADLDRSGPLQTAAGGDRRGYWEVFERYFPGFDAQLRERLPAVEAGYRALNHVLWRPGGLDPQWRELVFVVADLATTHLFTQGAALHIENALHYGATAAEVTEAIALTLALGGRSIEVAVPTLVAAINTRSVVFHDPASGGGNHD